MHGWALGSKPEAITGIPPKVNTGQRREEPASLAIVSIYRESLGNFHTLCTQSFSVFSRLVFQYITVIYGSFRVLPLCKPYSTAANAVSF